MCHVSDCSALTVALVFVVPEILADEPTCEVFVCVLDGLLRQDLHAALLHSNHLRHRDWNFNHRDKYTQR